MGNAPTITAEYVRSRLDYDPESGLLFWKPKIVIDTHYDVIWNTRYAGNPAGTATRLGYKIVTLDMRKRFAHRLAWLHFYGIDPGAYPKFLLDHIDGDGFNNRIVNLRVASPPQNGWNAGKHSRNTSGIKGVYWDKSRSKWLAAIGVNNKIKNLGRYSTKEEAAAVYAEAARLYHGEFANLG
jgi:hypothetical protein